jgi:nitrite reductase (cytochrome c-552)
MFDKTSSKKLLWAVLITAVLTFGVAALLINIFEHKQESRNAFFRVVELTDDTDDPAVWGKNFPLQYDSYKRTVDQTRTRYGGSEALPHAPTQADPRSAVSPEKIEQDTRLKTMWAGYAFSVDFREERGHAYMLDDQRYTKRVTDFKQPGTCLNCHASTYTLYKKLGDGDIFKGFDKLNHMTYNEAAKLAKHPVACIDCHDPATMQLRVTKPAFIEGIRAYKASQGVKDYDPNTMASAQEMRSFVCGQCHVEYHFKGDEKRLTFPWKNGLKAEDMYAYYEEIKFKDWTHKETGAPALKAQHPEFEFWNQGIHARSGVACADCHMPYKREGGMKISDHWVRSPLLNINRACQGCHHFSEEEMKSRVEQIQNRFTETRNVAMDALMDLISETKKLREAGATDEQLKGAWAAQRKAQFFIDLVEAENSTGFHAPGESLRVLTQALDTIRKGQLSLREVTPNKKAAVGGKPGSQAD